jgi:hypothetical protein
VAGDRASQALLKRSPDAASLFLSFPFPGIWHW